MNLTALKALIDSDPGNATKTDQQVLDWCNDKTITVQREIMSGSELLLNTDGDELEALTNDQSQLWISLCGVDNVPVSNGNAAVKMAVSIFGAGSQTLTNLSAARDSLISPSENAGLGWVRMGHVIEARAL